KDMLRAAVQREGHVISALNRSEPNNDTDDRTCFRAWPSARVRPWIRRSRINFPSASQGSTVTTWLLMSPHRIEASGDGSRKPLQHPRASRLCAIMGHGRSTLHRLWYRALVTATMPSPSPGQANG